MATRISQKLKDRIVSNRSITIQTGLVGMHILNLAFEHEMIPKSERVKTWTYIPERRRNFIEVSIINKHALSKILIDLHASQGYKYIPVYGTLRLGRSNSFQSAVKFIKDYITKNPLP